jgi:hypothetical protein
VVAALDQVTLEQWALAVLFMVDRVVAEAVLLMIQTTFR